MLALVRDGKIDIPFLCVERECEGSRYHTPTPLEVAPYLFHVDDIAAYYGPSTSDATWLCGTCAANLRVFFGLMRGTDGSMPWEVQREFGNGIRRIGKMMWRAADA
jgi:hypothetical protein